MKMLFHTGTSEAKDTVGVQSPVKVCMHVAGEVRDDNRIKREAAALIEAGFAVCIVDIESDDTRPIEEDMSLDFQAKNAGESWIVENISEGGFGAIVPQVKGDWIKVGSLLGVQSETAQYWGRD